MSEPYYEDDSVTIWAGDCLDVLREMPDASVDAIVTDPPYGLGFMGQKWDTYANETGRAKSAGAKFDHIGGNHNPSNSADATRTRRVESQRFGEWCDGWVAECLRVLKPGGHMLSFGGTRTWHRLACAVEDAGFEVRDSIAWLYGSGFPKSLDVSKAIDKAAGATREVVGPYVAPDGKARPNSITESDFRSRAYRSAQGYRPDGPPQAGEELNGTPKTITAPATPAAQQWQGWGTALKPAFEPVVVARKPLIGTVAANVLAHGTGALNVDGCRVSTSDNLGRPEGKDNFAEWSVGMGGQKTHHMLGRKKPATETNPAGRWPTNVVLDGDAAAELDEQSGVSRSSAATGVVRRGRSGGIMGAEGAIRDGRPEGHNDEGGASRFFPVFRYQAKAPTRERVKVGDVAHPTVKPLALMRWLVRLVTPPGGVVLDPFAGSGTTIEAAILEGFQCIGIEREADYLPLIEARIARNRATDEGLPVDDQPALFDLDGDAA